MAQDSISYQTMKKPLKMIGYFIYLVLFLEVSLQAFYYLSSGAFLFQRHAVPIYRSDQYMGYAVKANLSFHHVTNEFDTHLYTNGEGFRTSQAHEEYSIPSDQSRFRVMLLGPSFAFGWGVNNEDSFAEQLKKNLAAEQFATGRLIEIVNAGVPAAAPANQLKWFENYGQRYSPDLVIQFVYGGMWVSDAVDNHTRVDEKGYLISGNQNFRVRARSFLKNFAVVHYGWVAYTSIKSGATSSEGKPVVGAGRDLEQQTRFDPQDAATRNALNYYSRLSASTANAKARLLIVHFPLSYCVHRGDINRWKHLGVTDVDGQLALNRRFCDYLNQQAVPCLDISQDLVDEAKRSDERLYYWLDIHWTAKGNRLAAQVVARHLLNSE